jgi:hypothetical protein
MRSLLFDFRIQKLPTKLAQLSVIGARVALGLFASLDEVADASLVGSGIGDADTGIVGVCLCWWNAEGCQCYGCCRRHAHYCPLHQFFLFLTPNGRVVVATDTVSHFVMSAGGKQTPRQRFALYFAAGWMMGFMPAVGALVRRSNGSWMTRPTQTRPHGHRLNSQHS